MAELGGKNIAYIDGQNLYMGTTRRQSDPWSIDLARFRVYLSEKYHVDVAYYFLGVVNQEFQSLYEEIQKSGFILTFRQHSGSMVGKKKGNVDSDIIFHVMRGLYLRESFHGVVLVSGDGDYKLLVDFLIQEGRLIKILFPEGKKASSLYKRLGSEYFASLDEPAVKKKLESQKKRKGLLRQLTFRIPFRGDNRNIRGVY